MIRENRSGDVVAAAAHKGEIAEEEAVDGVGDDIPKPAFKRKHTLRYARIEVLAFMKRNAEQLEGDLRRVEPSRKEGLR